MDVLSFEIQLIHTELAQIGQQFGSQKLDLTTLKIELQGDQVKKILSVLCSLKMRRLQELLELQNEGAV